MVLVYYSTPSRVRPVTTRADNAQANRRVGVFTMHNAATGHGIRPINYQSVFPGQTSRSRTPTSILKEGRRCYPRALSSQRKPDALAWPHIPAQPAESIGLRPG
jgi:hypothetical protein